MKNVKTNNGITLIALVATIIVLLILAAVTIGLVLGQNGIIGKANKAKSATDIAIGKDQVQLALASVVSDKLENGQTRADITSDDLQKELRNTDSVASVTGTNPNFLAKYHVNGTEYEYGINTNTQTVTVPEIGANSEFNAEEWDKTATDESYFIWGSDIEGEEGYHIIVGYQEKLSQLYKVRIPSRCTSIDLNEVFIGMGTSRWEYTVNTTSVEIPETVTNIGTNAFEHFSNLTNINIPNSVLTVGDEAFLECSSLTNIEIPNSVQSIGTYAFCNTGVSKINIPNSVTNIGDYAFNGCDNLTNIILSDNITFIGASAFSDCGSLTSIEIPANVKNMGDGTFWLCSNLTSVTFKGSTSPTFGSNFFGGQYGSGYCEKLKKIYIPVGSNSSYEEAFGVQTFDGTNLVKDLIVENNLEEWDKTATDESLFIWGSDIEGEAGYNTIVGYELEVNGLSKLVIPSRCKKIESIYMVSDGTTREELSGGIQLVALPNTIEEIGEDAFMDFKDLKFINIPKGVHTIGIGAFERCISLQNVTIPDSVKTIEYRALLDCTSLTTVYTNNQTVINYINSNYTNITIKPYEESPNL